MSYVVMRGFQAMVDASVKDADSETQATSQAFYEGFALGLHEADWLTSAEYDGCIDHCSNEFTGLSQSPTTHREG